MAQGPLKQRLIRAAAIAAMFAAAAGAVHLGGTLFDKVVGPPQQPRINEITYNDFLRRVDDGRIKKVIIDGPLVFSDPLMDKYYRWVSYAPPAQFENVASRLYDKGIHVIVAQPSKSFKMTDMLISWLPFVALLGFGVFLTRRAQNGGLMQGFNASRARLMGKEQGNVTFKDVAGASEAKADLQEIVDFLRNPGKYEQVGGKIPRGVLLVGPPGTGKTLIARAVAGEAQVPFYSISGSAFVELYVGVGAGRVRSMFEQARKNAPCIIFIDEIDAIGKSRTSYEGNSEREQTLNQLLVELDGITQDNKNIILIAASNRPDVLDAALKRPGRFDREIVVPLPDMKDREEILNVHVRNVPLAQDVKMAQVAQLTPGMSGADLANLVNEAALLAARRNKQEVGRIDFDDARDKLVMGVARKTVMSWRDRRQAACREAAKALVSLLQPGSDPVYKTSILSRGARNGVTALTPPGDRVSMSLEKMNARLVFWVAGRVAEEILYGADHLTSGNERDIKSATDFARDMVTKWGMSSLGPVQLGESRGGEFLQRADTSSSVKRNYSKETQAAIDAEIRKMLDRATDMARKILIANKPKLQELADALERHETLDLLQVRAIVSPIKPSLI